MIDTSEVMEKVILVAVKRNDRDNTEASLDELEDVHVFSSLIHVDSTVEWAQDNSQPVVAYKRYSRSAIEYTKLAKEIIEYANR